MKIQILAATVIHYLLSGIAGLALLASLTGLYQDSRNRQQDLLILLKRLPGVTASLFLLWQLAIRLDPAFPLHFIGMTLACHMLGWRMALISGSISMSGLAMATGQGETLLASWFSLVLLPLMITQASLNLSQKLLPHNYFVFFFASGFFAAMLGMALAFTSLGWLLLQDNLLSIEVFESLYLPVLPMAMFAEGFLNGALLAIFVVYKPQWVSSFKDRLYLPFRSDV